MSLILRIYNAIVKFLADRGFSIDAYANTLHFYGSFMLVIFLTVCGLGVWWSALAVLGVGIAKELVDWKIRGTGFSWKDILIDCIGILVGVLFCSGVAPK
jgi:hypothetical protein